MRLSFFFLSLFCSILVYSQELPFRLKEKWGICDTNYNIIIPANYDSIWFGKNLEKSDYIVFNSGKYGVLSNNKEIIPCQYDSIQYARGKQYFKGITDMSTNTGFIIHSSGKKLFPKLVNQFYYFTYLDQHSLFVVEYQDGSASLVEYEQESGSISEFPIQISNPVFESTVVDYKGYIPLVWDKNHPKEQFEVVWKQNSPQLIQLKIPKSSPDSTSPQTNSETEEVFMMEDEMEEPIGNNTNQVNDYPSAHRYGNRIAYSYQTTENNQIIKDKTIDYLNPSSKYYQKEIDTLTIDADSIRIQTLPEDWLSPNGGIKLVNRINEVHYQKNGKWGLISDRGIIPPIYESDPIFQFQRLDTSFYLIQKSVEGKIQTGLIDYYGDPKLPYQFDSIILSPYILEAWTGVHIGDNYRILTKQGGKWAVNSISGKLYTQHEYDSFIQLNQNFYQFALRKAEKWAYYDGTFMLTPATFPDIPVSIHYHIDQFLIRLENQNGEFKGYGIPSGKYYYSEGNSFNQK